MSASTELISPWRHSIHNLPSGKTVDFFTTDAADREKQILASVDVPWLKSVLAWPDNQVSVFLAADRRLKKLARERKKL